MEDSIDVLLKSDNLCIGELILEYELIIHDISVNLAKVRKFNQHKRIPGKSRQISSLILDNPKSLSKVEKTIEYKRLLRLDASRRLLKKSFSDSLATSLYSLVCLPGKASNSTICKIDPNLFYQKIYDDELSCNHETHPVHEPVKDIIDTNFKISDIKSKFKSNRFFVLKFWEYIKNLLFSSRDYGVEHYSTVELVIKDKKSLDELKGWRMVWKTPLIPKFLDSLKAKCIKTTNFENCAYTENRSTTMALSKLCNMHFTKKEGLLGVDFKNAFALCCRQCANCLLGLDFMPKEVYFHVLINSNISNLGISTAGSGAGKPTGGPIFNTILDSVFKDQRFDLKKLVVYADDSVYKVSSDPILINDTISKYEYGRNFGLSPHLTGKKGPTFVSRNKKLCLDNCNATLLKSVPFLGVQVHISDTGYIVASSKPETIRNLNFLAYSLGHGLNLARMGASISVFDNIFKVASSSIACLIESRIQYILPFAGKLTILKLYNIHKVIICKLLGFKPKFFGFTSSANIKKYKDNDYVENMWSFISQIESNTYRVLAAIANRPTLSLILYKGCKVVLKQSLFNVWSTSYDKTRPKMSVFQAKIVNYITDSEKFIKLLKKSKLNSFYSSIRSIKKRRIFIKLATERFFGDNLRQRGFECDNLCRWCNNKTENIDHVLTCQSKLFTQSEAKCLMKTKVLKRKFGLEVVDSLSDCFRLLTVRLINDNTITKTPSKLRRIDQQY